MQTIKTALVVVALLAALFVAYQVVNKQPIELPFDLAGIPVSPEASLESTGALSVEAPSVLSEPTGQPWPSAATGRSPFPNVAAGITPPAFAATPSATDVSPSNADPVAGYVQQASQSMPASPAISGSGSPSAPPAVAVGSARPSPLAAAPIEPTSSSVPSGQTGPRGAAESATQSADGASPETTAAITRYSFEQAWQKGELQIGEGELARALLTLSEFYRNSDLDEASQARLNERLDQLAGTVIYSRRHLLEESYKATRGDTLHDLASRYNVSARLIQNINGIQDPNLVLPGTELKLVRGPFRAEVDLSRGEATMFLGGLYAGRFAIRSGRDPAPRPGEYKVLAIEAGRTYYLPSGQTIPPGAAANPYGQWWIDLGGEQSIHGSPDSGAEPIAGCLSLSARDAVDVAAILSVGSKVVIR